MVEPAPPDHDADAHDEDEHDDGHGDAGDDGAADGSPGAWHARMPKVLPTLLPGAPSWPAVFGRRAPLEVELGFGRPHFLLERSAEVPAHDLVGIEWKGRWPAAVHARQARGAFPNVRALHGNAWLLFGSLFAPSSLTWIVLNFPDPWWKSKHQKRRIVSDAFARLLASRLAPGGRILVQTDVASLLEEYLARLEAQPGLQNPAGPFRLAPRKPMTASSHREKRCRRDGVPIFRAVLERVDYVDAAAKAGPAA
ncbi:MAG: tRNA (guanine-N7)-methyltransferase [Deltaproteobacteria bacterium]|nr:tRNA (guanine-N7)-methyltransferase [Deltaproteobacteria bacterium]